MKLSVRRGKLLRSSALATLLVAAAASTASAAEPTYQFNIPAESLSRALTDFSQASSQQIIYTEDLVRGHRSAGLHGSFTAQQALEALLVGTDLKIQTNAAGVMMVRSKNVQAASNEAASTGGIETVVVTGSHIVGAAPVGSSIRAYDRKAIEQSGAGNLGDFARQMDQNFSGADEISNFYSNAIYGHLAEGANDNAFAGASFDLHGLGTTSTLTLLDGHRLAPAGGGGLLTDVSMIPISAIERLEVLSDGASAIYGADAVAGVVNVITRKNFDGAETSLRYGGATDGGAIEVNASQVVGMAWRTGNILVNYEYGEEGGLDASQRDYIPSLGGPYSLIPASHQNSIFAVGNQQISSDVTLSGELLYSRRRFQDRTSTQSLVADISSSEAGEAEQFSGSGTIDISLGGDWVSSTTANYASTGQSVTTPVEYSFGGFLFDQTAFLRTDTKNFSAESLLNGSLFETRAGEAKVALGVSYRHEAFGQTNETTSSGVTTNYSPPPASRNVESIFAELLIPIVGLDNSRPFIKGLDLSVAGRFDNYSDFGSTTNPKIGVRWQISDGLALRSSFGTSFRAPPLSQLGGIIYSYAAVGADAASPTGFSDTLNISGGNPALRPETARSFSAGTDLAPTFIPRLNASLTYFDVQYDNRIATPLIVGPRDFANPLLAPFVIRNPPLSTVQAFFNSPGFQGDYNGGGPAAVRVIFDDQVANVSTTKQSGLDFLANYTIETDQGDVGLDFSGTRLLSNGTRPVAGAPIFSLLNTFAEPTAWKLRGGVSWSWSGFSARSMINYVNAYANNLVTPTQRIGSWTTIDLSLSYSAQDDAPQIFSGLSLTLTARNLLDQQPPYAAPLNALLPGQKPIPVDSANASPVGRFLALQITKRW